MQLAGPITSEKLLLRSLSPDDASDLYLSWLSDCEINRYLEVRFSPPRTVVHLANFITEANASSQTLLLGIFLKRNGRHIVPYTRIKDAKGTGSDDGFFGYVLPKGEVVDIDDEQDFLFAEALYRMKRDKC